VKKIEVVTHDVTWNELLRSLSPELQKFFSDVAEDFKDYKEKDETPEYFGRDTVYLQPPLAEQIGLMHIHLAVPPFKFDQNRTAYDRVCPRDNPNCDAALIYVNGWLENHRYCLLGILWPSAHEQQRKAELMQRISRHAKTWRDLN
jgi:mRNA interferase YafO